MSAYDAVIVGAGPAGSATAAHLARDGRRVLLVDRAHFPRDKACGGGLTPRGVAALRRLGVDTAARWVQPASGVAVTGARGTATAAFPATSRWPSETLVARRIDLDAAVLERAVAAGAEFRPGVRVVGPVMEDGVCRGVSVARGAEREQISAPLTVAADGATSVLARGAGLAGPASSGRGFWYAAMRGYFSPVRGRGPAGAPLLEFYPLRAPSGRWLPGYGWVFPLPDGSANVGVDLPHRPALAGSPGLRDAYGAFVAALRRDHPGFAGAVEEAPPVGALLPEGMAGARPGVPGLLAAGDAAGLITPYSGEGIAYALESAEHVASAASYGAPSAILDAYRSALWQAYGFQFTTALWFMKAVRRPWAARLGATFGIGSDRVLRAALRIMAYLIEDDPAAPASTVSSGYRAARRLARLEPPAGWR